MSRIGRLPIDIPAGVEVKIEEGNKVTVKGPKGTLEKCLPVEMTIKQEDNQVVVTRPNDLKKMKSLHGLTRSLIANIDRKSTRLNSSHTLASRMPSSA